MTVVHVAADADERAARRARRRDAGAADRARRHLRAHRAGPSRRCYGDERIEGVILDDGTTLPADMVVLACGVRPRVDVARASGLPVNKGIIVNDTLATQVPGVYAFGECAEHRGRIYGIVAPVWEQAAVLADVLSGAKPAVALPRLEAVHAAQGGRRRRGVDGQPRARARERRGLSDHRGAQSAYRKLIVRDGQLVGAMLVGNTDGRRQRWCSSSTAAIRCPRIRSRSCARRARGGAAARPHDLQLPQGHARARCARRSTAAPTTWRRSASAPRPAPAAGCFDPACRGSPATASRRWAWRWRAEQGPGARASTSFDHLLDRIRQQAVGFLVGGDRRLGAGALDRQVMVPLAASSQ